MINGFYEYHEVSKAAKCLWNQDTFKSRRLLKKDKLHLWSPASWVSAMLLFFLGALQAHQWPRMSVQKPGRFLLMVRDHTNGLGSLGGGRDRCWCIIWFRFTRNCYSGVPWKFQLFWNAHFGAPRMIHIKIAKNVCANAFWNRIFHTVAMFEGVECDCSSWAPVALPKVFDN